MVAEEDVTPSPAMASEDVPWGEHRPVKKPVVLFAGRVLEAGPVEETIGRPRDPYTIRLLEDVPMLAHREAVPGEPTQRTPEPPGGVPRDLHEVSHAAEAKMPPRARG